nr:alpha/beta fold hydrolase [Glaciibacter flavus]
MSVPLSVSISTTFGDVSLTADERGTGRPVVILHGGAGPMSVTGFADLLAEATGTRVIVPTHPGFGGTPRPAELSSIAELAELYAGLLETLDLTDVVVIGNSMGGWITAELALRHPDRLGRIILVDSVGIDVPGHPVAASLPPSQLAEYSWYDPSKAPRLDPAKLSPEMARVLAGNQAALALYGQARPTRPCSVGSQTSVSPPSCSGARPTAWSTRTTGARSPPRFPHHGSSCSRRPGTCRRWRRLTCFWPRSVHSSRFSRRAADALASHGAPAVITRTGPTISPHADR